jgi:hypothetical protein
LNLSFVTKANQAIKPSSIAVKSKKRAKAKQTKKTEDKNSGSLGKNEILTVMHGLGRVFHPKLEKNEKTNISELTHKPETIAESFSSQPENIIRMIYSNYMKNYGDIDSLTEMAQMLSFSSFISSEYRDDQLVQLNLNLVVRAAMILNKNPAGGFKSVSSHISKKWRKVEEGNKDNFRKSMPTLNNGNMIASKAFYCDYNNFLSLSMNK